ncbi:MAG: alpha/beta hydrolase [Clostridia bacterium]|nr:alpha/beta hydrolase [Clostridia bacterium]
MLLLHGYLSNRQSFYYQIQALAQSGAFAVAPDMPAFGASSPIMRAWSVGDYAEWLKHFIDAADIKGADIIAHSFGARVALKLLSSDPSYADKLIITGGAGLVKPRSDAYIRQVKRYRRIKKLFPRYAEKHFGSEEYRSLSPIMKESYKKIVNEDLRGCARCIKNETLLIYGSADKVTPPDEEGAIFNSLIAGSALEIIDGGHFCFSENHAEFNRLMLGFLNGRSQD